MATFNGLHCLQSDLRHNSPFELFIENRYNVLLFNESNLIELLKNNNIAVEEGVSSKNVLMKMPIKHLFSSECFRFGRQRGGHCVSVLSNFLGKCTFLQSLLDSIFVKSSKAVVDVIVEALLEMGIVEEVMSKKPLMCLSQLGDNFQSFFDLSNIVCDVDKFLATDL